MTLHFPWWAIVAFGCAYAFVPIAIVTALVAVLYAFSRSRIALVMLIVAGIPCAIGGVTFLSIWTSDIAENRRAAADAAAHARVLIQAANVEGVVLPAGTRYQEVDDYMQYADPVVATLPHPTVVFGVPLQGDVFYFPSGLDGEETLSRDALVGTVPCRAGPIKFDRGALDGCSLSRVTRLSGVPCTGHVDFVGKNVQCVVAKPFRYRGVLLAAGLTFSFERVEFGARTPDTRLFGRRLPPQSHVDFNADGSVEFGMSNPDAGTYRGCTIRSLRIVHGDAIATGYDSARDASCSLRLPRHSVVL